MRSIAGQTVFLALCVGEVSVSLIIVCLYYLAFYPDLHSFLHSFTAIFLLVSIIAMALSVIFIIYTVRTNGLTKRKIAMMSATNLLMLILTVGSVEIGIRLIAKPTLTGETFRGILLKPRQWSRVKAQYDEVLQQIDQGHAFLIYDPLLGWTVAPSRQNNTGQNMSSAEGLRSPQVGIRFADRHTRHSGSSPNPTTYRIALLGDSMTYGNEVRCEDTWGHVLETNINTDVQVLNFGVSAYGLNQVLLRYQRDVRPWKPQIVIIGITSLEIQRLTWIYKFLNPYWSGDPFAYPRLVFANGTFLHINQPPIPPTEITSHAAVKDLPYIELDSNYRRLDWERNGTWQLLEKSYLFRFLISITPSREAPQEVHSDTEMVKLSRHVLKAIVQEVQRDGAIPVVIHLPYQYELMNVANVTLIPFRDSS